MMFVGLSIEVMFESVDDLVDMSVFFFQFLMMTAALKGISGSNEFRHLFIEFI